MAEADQIVLIIVNLLKLVMGRTFVSTEPLGTTKLKLCQTFTQILQ